MTPINTAKLPDFAAFQKFLDDHKDGLGNREVEKVKTWAESMKEWATASADERAALKAQVSGYEEELAVVAWNDSIVEMLEDVERGVRDLHEVMAEVRNEAPRPPRPEE